MNLPRLDPRYRTYNRVIAQMEKEINTLPPPKDNSTINMLQLEMFTAMKNDQSAAQRTIAILRYAFACETLGLRTR